METTAARPRDQEKRRRIPRIHTVVLILLVGACIAVGIARFGLRFRPRTRTVTAEEQRAFAEGLLPAAEQQLRERGVSEEEIAARIAKLRDAEAGFRDVESGRLRS